MLYQIYETQRSIMEPFADLAEVATRTGLTRDQVIATHLAGDYSVALYGFAPGYAYLSGLPEPLYALFGTGYLGYTAARQWGKISGSDK